MEKGNLEIIINNIETGEELVHDQASLIQAYILIPKDEQSTGMRTYLGGSGTALDFSRIYRETRDDALNELWDGELEKIKAVSKLCELLETEENKEK